MFSLHFVAIQLPITPLDALCQEMTALYQVERKRSNPGLFSTYLQNLVELVLISRECFLKFNKDAVAEQQEQQEPADLALAIELAKSLQSATVSTPAVEQSSIDAKPLVYFDSFLFFTSSRSH